jgi:hypothetical protein
MREADQHQEHNDPLAVNFSQCATTIRSKVQKFKNCADYDLITKYSEFNENGCHVNCTFPLVNSGVSYASDESQLHLLHLVYWSTSDIVLHVKSILTKTSYISIKLQLTQYNEDKNNTPECNRYENNVPTAGILISFPQKLPLEVANHFFTIPATI